jgi:hypothetical protein
MVLQGDVHKTDHIAHVVKWWSTDFAMVSVYVVVLMYLKCNILEGRRTSDMGRPPPVLPTCAARCQRHGPHASCAG